MWRDVSRFGPRAEQWAREANRASGPNPRDWQRGGRGHVDGKLAECVFSQESGLPVDWAVRAGGDGGRDFDWGGKKLNVRGRRITRWVRKPALLVQPPKEDRWSDLYVLVHLRGQEGCVMGWATLAQVQAAPMKEYGHGPSHRIEVAELTRWGQTGLPPRPP
jgi:hypothetical protein